MSGTNSSEKFNNMLAKLSMIRDIMQQPDMSVANNAEYARYVLHYMSSEDFEELTSAVDQACERLAHSYQRSKVWPPR